MTDDEELQMLWAPGEDSGRSRGRTIAAGALHFLKTSSAGPARFDLLGALLTGCLIAVSFIGLALVPAILTFAPHIEGTSRYHRRAAAGQNSGRPTNVYFIKHENRSWTNEEFCCMETAAHRYPQYNFFVINLLSEEAPSAESRSPAKYFDELLEESLSSGGKTISASKNSSSSEYQLREKLLQVGNIRSVDISVERLFARSIMFKKVRSLSSNEIELAAKFQVIWDSSGIALEPLIIHQLESVGRFMNKNRTDVVASVQVDNDLQATSVPCQSFYGFVISLMANGSFTDRPTLLRRALLDFCPSDKCTRTLSLTIHGIDDQPEENRLKMLFYFQPQQVSWGPDPKTGKSCQPDVLSPPFSSHRRKKRI